MAAWKRRNPERYLEQARRHSARRRALIRGTSIEDFTEQDVRDAYGDTCYLCDAAIDFDIRWPAPQSPSLDHVIPLARGGTHTLDNVAMTHLRCNHEKNARLVSVRPLQSPM
jgi:5-methylcytosine-specific restriction endonuclease McrA